MKITTHYCKNEKYTLARCNDLDGLPIRTVGKTRVIAMVKAMQELQARSK